MPILSYVRQIAVADQRARRRAVLGALEAMGCAYELQCAQIDGRSAQNVVVSIGQGTPRLLIGAHYDSVPGSSGANDNGSGVAILLDLIQTLAHTRLHFALDVVFFDLEEQNLLGSRGYLEHVSPTDICAMVNMDICGVGDTIVIAPRAKLTNEPLPSIVPIRAFGSVSAVHTLERLPPGDETSFYQAGIPSITVGIVPCSDVKRLEAWMNADQDHQPTRMPAVAETIHNGSRDSIDVVQEAALQLGRRWIELLVARYSMHRSEDLEKPIIDAHQGRIHP